MRLLGEPRVCLAIASVAVLLGFGALGCGSDESPVETGAGAGGTSASGGTGGEGATAGAGGSFVLPSQTDPERLAGFLQDLSAEDMQGRLTGSPSGAIAEQYVLAALEATGFAVETQDVPLPIYDLGSPVGLAIVDGGGTPTTTFNYIDQFREVMFAGSGAVTGALHFAGMGAEADYQGIDVTGRVVAILTGSSLITQFTLAHEKGAAGVVFIPAGDAAYYDDALGEFYQPYLFGLGGEVVAAQLVSDLPAVFVRLGAVASLLGKTAPELEADPTPFDPAIQVRVELHGTSYPDATCKNIFATIPGTDPAIGGEVISVGAHYDHIGLGADGVAFLGASDNASGPAVVLELANVLATIPTAPRRTVQLALWCGEEQGLYGSLHYTRVDPLLPLASTALYVNLDNIADPPGPYLVRVTEVPIQDAFLAPSAADPIQQQQLAFQCGSDECPFHLEDVPFLRYMCFGSDGHTRDDTFEQADLVGLGRVADEVLRGVGATAYQPN